MIEQLLDSESNQSQQKAALTRLGEVLEEDYILNLPPQRPILKALVAFARKASLTVPIRQRAKKLIKEYGV